MTGTMKKHISLKEAFEILGHRYFPKTWNGKEWSMLASSAGNYKRKDDFYVRAKHVLEELRYCLKEDPRSLKILNKDSGLYENPSFDIGELYVYDSLCADHEGHMYHAKIHVHEKSIFSIGIKPKKSGGGRRREYDRSHIAKLARVYIGQNKEKNLKQEAIVTFVVEQIKNEGTKKIPSPNTIRPIVKLEIEKFQKSNN
jgi:hypothetical protein